MVAFKDLVIGPVHGLVVGVKPGLVGIDVVEEGEEGAKKLGFEFFPADPKAKASANHDDEEDDEDEDGDPQLIEAAARKALPGPKDKPDRPKSSGTVPTVPPKKK